VKTKSKLDDKPNPTMPSNEAEAKKRAARETIDILHEISTLLVRKPISLATAIVRTQHNNKVLTKISRTPISTANH
jgi:hypothetical protein